MCTEQWPADRVWPPLGRVKNVRQGAASVSPYNGGVGEEAGRERRGIHEELYIQGGRQGLSRRKRRDDGPVLRTICGHRVEEHAHTLRMRLIMIYEVEMPITLLSHATSEKKIFLDLNLLSFIYKIK